MDDFEITAGKSKSRAGDTGVRGDIAAQLVGVQKNRAGQLVKRIRLNSFKYDVVQESDPTSDLTVPVVYMKAREIEAQETDKGAYLNNKGKWVVRLERKRMDPDFPQATDLETRYRSIMDTEVYFRCKVIWPEPHYGQVVPLSSPIGGIQFPKGARVMAINFLTDDQYVPRLMKLAVSFGFDRGYFTPGSPIFDPDYLKPFIQDLELPLTEEMVLERLLVPILVRHGQQGHLIMAETSENSHFLVGSSVKAVGEREAKAIWEQAKAWEHKEVSEPDPDAPFFDEDDPESEPEGSFIETAPQAPQAESGLDAEQLRGKIRALAANNDRFAWDVSEFLDKEGIPYNDESLLASLSVDALQRVIAHFSPKKPSL